LDPKVIDKVGRLELLARTIVEGFVSGLHRSPYKGFSVEFAEHREYVFGDDLRHLDWKVFGRTDRLYLKEYEQETNLRCYLALDTSKSMLYGGPEGAKLEYALALAAALSYLILRQRDAVGLVLFDQQIRRIVPASSNMAHIKALLAEMVSAQPSERTNIGKVLHDIAERTRQKGLMVLISDLLDEVPEVLSGLQHFRHDRHDVIVFHILHHDETSFPFERMTMFEGLEMELRLLADPRPLREAYLQEVEQFISRIRSGCLQHRIDYVNITTDQPLDVALTSYLAKRLKHRR
jgi:uncharacterized protein (DUF58 family)